MTEETIAIAKAQGVTDFDTCYAYAVFPSITSAGIGIGGKGGKGEVFLQDGKKVGSVTYGSGTVGGIGIDQYKQIVFIADEEAYNKFTSGKFELKFSYKATAGTASAGAAVGTDTHAEGGVGESGGAMSAYVGGVKVVVLTSAGLYVCGPIPGPSFGFGELGGGKYTFTAEEE